VRYCTLYGRLRAVADGDRVYSRLGKLFGQADDRYNSGPFHFKAEKGRHEAPDDEEYDATDVASLTGLLVTE
jgi:hypothetical protein